MRVYLDLCCLKRPFDLQDQAVIRLQTEAVLSLLALPAETVQYLRSPALILENSLNPNQARREAVDLWLSRALAVEPDEVALQPRIQQLIESGFKNFDAFHIASAELSGAAAFLTVDLPLLKLAARMTNELRIRVLDPIHFVEEIAQWKH